MSAVHKIIDFNEISGNKPVNKYRPLMDRLKEQLDGEESSSAMNCLASLLVEKAIDYGFTKSSLTASIEYLYVNF